MAELNWQLASCRSVGNEETSFPSLPKLLFLPLFLLFHGHWTLSLCSPSQPPHYNSHSFPAELSQQSRNPNPLSFARSLVCWFGELNKLLWHEKSTRTYCRWMVKKLSGTNKDRTGKRLVFLLLVALNVSSACFMKSYPKNIVIISFFGWEIWIRSLIYLFLKTNPPTNFHNNCALLLI